MRMGRIGRGIVFFGILLSLSGCAGAEKQDEASTEMAQERETAIAFSEIRVLQSAECKDYAENDYVNITPDFIADHSAFEILKNVTDADTCIVYDGVSYPIGVCHGGFGMTSMALADLNKDGEYELYYTYSFGSGVHISSIGYFDPVNKEVTEFAYSLNAHQKELLLTVNEAGDLCVNIAQIDSYQSFVDFSLKAQELVGRILYEENEITLHEDGTQYENLLEEPDKAAEESEVPALSDDMLAYWRVLNSRQPFVSTDEGCQAFFWDEYHFVLGEVRGRRQADDFMIVDMDGDGAEEIVLYCSPESVQILHYEDGVVYGYQFVFRGMVRIRENGIYEGSDGAAGTSYYRLTEFHKEGCTEQKIAGMEGDYYEVEGAEASYEEFCEYVEPIENTAKAVCIEFTEDMLDKYLLGNLSEREIDLVKQIPAETPEKGADYQAYKQALQLYAAVLTGEQDVILATEDTVSYADETVAVYFSLTDMDGDGVCELLFTCDYDVVWILYEKEGKVYGYCLRPAPVIMVDGIFQTENKELSPTGYARITAFAEDGCLIEPVGADENRSQERIRYYFFSKEKAAYLKVK